MSSNFIAMLIRMKYIERWSLMRNSQRENISEHSLETAVIAHLLSVIGNVRLGKNLNEEKAALFGIYHDASEIITGDMPTPIKYSNKEIERAFKDVENVALVRLLDMLPDDLKHSYEEIFIAQEKDEYLWKIVKGADKLSALIKCIEERKAGNTEFLNAEAGIMDSLLQMNLEEVNIFLQEFLPACGKNLDELKIEFSTGRK